MLSRFGLRLRMAASYVVISAAAVLLLEAVVLAYLIPRVRDAQSEAVKAGQRAAMVERDGVWTKARAFADQDAAAASRAAAGRAALSDEALLTAAARGGYGIARSSGPPELVEALAGLDGRVVATSSAKVVPVGSRLPSDATMPKLVNGSLDGGYWSTAPVIATDAHGVSRTFGIAFVRVAPQQASLREGLPATGAETTDTKSMLIPGLIMLALLIPAGAAFGLLSTRRLIGRIRRLSDGTAAMAAGDLRARIPVSGADEVGRLEEAFNRMAGRLELAVRLEREAAGAEERNRIARDLHDSVSQDLFSANLLAGGLRRALPPESELRRRAESMEQTLEQAMREMRSMLLELRPVALEEAGLAAALTSLCQAYEVRLGIRITAKIDTPELAPEVELAILRVVQEALGNATRHAGPAAIELRVTQAAGQIMVLISDDGCGFEPDRVAGRHGMGMALMRERVAELGGTFEVASVPAEGTTVRVRIPA